MAEHRLHAFVERIFHLRVVYKSIPDVQEVLLNQFEKNKEHYSHFSADTKDIIVEFETRARDPLILYDSDTTDLFLSILTEAFKVNVIVFQSDNGKCRFVNMSNQENPFKETLYFARSLHIDRVIPCEKPHNFKSQPTQRCRKDVVKTSYFWSQRRLRSI